jgi:hypothetical protein
VSAAAATGKVSKNQRAAPKAQWPFPASPTRAMLRHHTRTASPGLCGHILTGGKKEQS